MAYRSPRGVGQATLQLERRLPVRVRTARQTGTPALNVGEVVVCEDTAAEQAKLLVRLGPTTYTLSGATVALSDTVAVALGVASAGTGALASRYDHVHPTTGLSLTGHTHDVDDLTGYDDVDNGWTFKNGTYEFGDGIGVRPLIDIYPELVAEGGIQFRSQWTEDEVLPTPDTTWDTHWWFRSEKGGTAAIEMDKGPYFKIDLAGNPGPAATDAGLGPKFYFGTTEPFEVIIQGCLSVGAAGTAMARGIQVNYINEADLPGVGGAPGTWANQAGWENRVLLIRRTLSGDDHLYVSLYNSGTSTYISRLIV